MIILGIETSCDETALCLVEADGSMISATEGDIQIPNYRVLANAIFSQAELHEKYGGVYPMLAKREHIKNLVPLLEVLLKEAYPMSKSELPISKSGLGIEQIETIKGIFQKEQGFKENFIPFIESVSKPKIDLIAVTKGPGLEPALWVGLNFARALSFVWNIPIIPINHMEGHIFSPLIYLKEKITFPVLALLISGGHTELVLSKKIGQYKILGQTRDDSIGEAFDKVARLLKLPYPGGPHISRLAEKARVQNIKPEVKLPRPMIKSGDFDFSFSGIKTSVLYSLKKIKNIDEKIQKEYSLEFENAVTEVLLVKTKKALEQYEIKTLILGGGVSANTHIQKSFTNLENNYKNIKILIPHKNLSTDNAIMISVAGYINFILNKPLLKPPYEIKAEGNLKLDKIL